LARRRLEPDIDRICKKNSHVTSVAEFRYRTSLVNIVMKRLDALFAFRRRSSSMCLLI